MALSHILKFLDLEMIIIPGRTFVKMRFHMSVPSAVIKIDNNVDDIMQSFMKLPGIYIIYSERPIQTMCTLDQPEGFICIHNIEFNSSVMPLNMVPVESINNDQIFHDITKHIFGNHVGYWCPTEKCYTAVVIECMIPGSISKEPIFYEMSAILSTYYKERDFSILYQSLRKLELIFTTNIHSSWWNLYFEIFDLYINGNSLRSNLAPVNDMKSRIMNNITWNLDWMVKECEICLTPKEDLGVLFAKKRNSIYVSPMMTCFSCFTGTAQNIKDHSYKECSQWLPLFHTILGFYLFQKSGNQKHLNDVILFFLKKETLNEKELFITESLLYLFKAFNKQKNAVSKNLEAIINRTVTLNLTVDYVHRLICNSGSLHERLVIAYTKLAILDHSYAKPRIDSVHLDILN